MEKERSPAKLWVHLAAAWLAVIFALMPSLLAASIAAQVLSLLVLFFGGAAARFRSKGIVWLYGLLWHFMIVGGGLALIFLVETMWLRVDLGAFLLLAFFCAPRGTFLAVGEGPSHTVTKKS